MDFDYVYEMNKAINEKFKKDKKNKEKICLETKNELLKFIKLTENTKKGESVLKNKYNILNKDIFNPDLEDIYFILLNKLLFVPDDSKLFSDWNNIFSYVFANMPAIYEEMGLDFVKKIVVRICNTKDDSKFKVLMKLFIAPYHIEEKNIEIIDKLLSYIDNIEDSYKFQCFEVFIDNIYHILNNSLMFNNINIILNSFNNSISEFNSGFLSDLLKLFINTDDLKDDYLFELFDVFAISNNEYLLDSYYTIIKDNNFINLDNDVKKKCFGLFENVSKEDMKKYELITKIILEIIVYLDIEELRNFLLEKINSAKNIKTLELIVLLNPILSTFSDNKEFINVIDSLEDKNGNFTKKLVINIDNE